jgi:hypothetical protein
MQYELSIIQHEGRRVINFANRGSEFVEVVFALNGREVNEDKELSSEIKGFAYPPRLEKPVKKTKRGTPIILGPRGGEVVAYVFAGDGRYREEDLEKPAFLRHKLVDKIKFKRTSDHPVEVLRVVY